MFTATNGSEWDLKLKAGTRMIPVKIAAEGERLFFKFGFNKPLMEEVKAMQGAKYHGYDEFNPRKVWSVLLCEHNLFQISYLAHPGRNDPENPYSWYDRPLDPREPRRTVYAHQRELFQHGYTYHYVIWGAEMGVGKTLAAIEVIEASGAHNVLWAAPKPALVSVKLEFRKWGCKVVPTFVTYEGLKKLLAEWPTGKKPPQVVIYDESSRLKNPTAQRTQAADHLATAVRREWGHQGFVIEMSGSPAPKSPVDWWSQCHIARPGFLKEGSIEKLKKRLAIIETRESFAGGGAYPHLVSWRDDARKCDVCGLFENAETHSSSVDVFAESSTNHKFIPSVNEIDLLYRRMKGLVLVKFKKDCLDLPDKVYRLIELKPSRSTMNAAGAIAATAPSVIVAMTLLRELSDGFQYVEQVSGIKACEMCHGLREVEHHNYGEREPTESEIATGQYEDGTPLVVTSIREPCNRCDATGFEDRHERISEQIPTPKEGALRDLLDENEEVGRIVVYGGFQGSIDRICSICQSSGWKIIKVDGRGWHTDLPINGPEAMIMAFQRELGYDQKIAFVAQPGSGGMGLTLTAACMIVYFSNDFNAESRIQSEDRIHRSGMDANRGATIVDLIHLKTDLKVFNNLKEKRRLQDISMGELKAVLAASETELDSERVT